MKIRATTTLAILAVFAALLIAACAPQQNLFGEKGLSKNGQQGEPAAAAQQSSPPPAPPQLPAEQQTAGAVPEIAQAEQAIQEIGTEDVGEIGNELDTLILP
ncbi:hypothetical protein HYU17_04330 [Candidatus Woesearchaeota archaeon]|nr:hypothetical protein [Candidatus Woesearchaeota archaeon]